MISQDYVVASVFVPADMDKSGCCSQPADSVRQEAWPVPDSAMRLRLRYIDRFMKSPLLCLSAGWYYTTVHPRPTQAAILLIHLIGKDCCSPTRRSASSFLATRGPCRSGDLTV